MVNLKELLDGEKDIPNSDGALEFRVIPVKSKFSYYEPIRGRFVLTNVSDRPIVINKKLSYGIDIDINFKIVKQRGKPAFPEPIFELSYTGFDCPAPNFIFPVLEDFITLKSGERYQERFCFDYRYPHLPPGLQKISVIYNSIKLERGFPVLNPHKEELIEYVNINAWVGRLRDECIVEITSRGRAVYRLDTHLLGDLGKIRLTFSNLFKKFLDYLNSNKR